MRENGGIVRTSNCLKAGWGTHIFSACGSFSNIYRTHFWVRSSYWSTYFVVGDPQITVRSKICITGDPHTIVRSTLYFEDEPQNIVLSNPQFWGRSSKYCAFKTVISLKKTLRKCSEFRTKYGTNLACILVYFSYAFFIRVKSRFLS